MEPGPSGFARFLFAPYGASDPFLSEAYIGRWFGCWLHIVQCEDLRYPLGPINPAALYFSALIRIQENGIDFHVDWAASKFVNKTMHVGLAGYAYQQITGDTGLGAKLGDFKGGAVGIGPQIGFFFPAGNGYTGYLNVRSYWDVVTENRPTTNTVMVTLGFTPSAPEKPSTPTGPKR